VELFEGHARSGDLRAQMFLGDEFKWIEQGKAVKEVNGVNGKAS
jgi:hypothetical protein